MPGGSSVSSTSSCKRPPAPPPSASRCRGTIRRTTPPPSGNTSPTTELFGIVRPIRGEKIRQRITLDRNDLGGFTYSRANKQSTRPCRLDVIAYWLLSSCLIVCSSRSVRFPAMPGVRLRYPESKRSLIFCQALFSKMRVFGSFFA